MSVTINTPLTSTQLRDVVLGKNPALPRRAAMSLLRLSGERDKTGVFQALLEDENEAPRYRFLAAANLYQINTKESRDVLLRALDKVKDAGTLGGIVKALGRVGDQTALERVLKVKAGSRGVLAQQAQFAAALLSHRFGLPGNDLVPPTSFYPMPTSGVTPVQVIAPASAEVSLCLDSLVGEPYGITLSKGNLKQMVCENKTWMLALNQEFDSPQALEILQKRKSLLGVLAGKNAESGRYSGAFLVLTAPVAGKVNVFVNRVTGEPGFFGEAVMERGRARFKVKSVARVGVFPIEAEGTYAPGGIEIASARSALTIMEKRSPQLLKPG